MTAADKIPDIAAFPELKRLASSFDDLNRTLQLCDACYGKKKIKEAKALFTIAQEQYSESWDILVSVIPVMSIDDQNYEGICNLIRDSQDLYGRYFSCAKMLKIDLAALEDCTSAYLVFMHGDALTHLGEYESGIKKLQESLTYKTTDFRVLAYMGMSAAYSDMGEYEKALEAAESSLALDESAMGCMLKADALVRLGRVDEGLSVGMAAIASHEDASPELIEALKELMDDVVCPDKKKKK